MKKNINQKTNRLINEKNPYLLQHANNPVDWYPWGNEAFEKAEAENKPVFLSIGYSTCHWCHVMAYESFEDEDIAKMMNDAFINIKVDREERPDIDSIYMQVCQMLTGSGGWPLTVIMTPDKKPFFAGTYFPKDSVINRIGMRELIPRIKELWDTRKDDVLGSADDMVERIKYNKKAEKSELNEKILQQTFEMLKEGFDGEYGGFGSSSKFPIPHNLSFLLSYYNQTKNPNALAMVEKTLVEMGKGGIYDQLGFGFHRYSTDRIWLVPHFEKMLYDQALLVIVYTQLWQFTGKDEHKQKVYEIFDYVLRKLTSSENAFYCAEDADSEGEEGKFYVWKADELKELLKEDYEIGKAVFSIREEGNFHDERTEKYTGKNILHFTKSIEELSKQFGLNEDDLRIKVEDIRKKLFGVREKRVHPFKDEKVLTDWNGLMMSAYGFAGRIFEDKALIETAKINHDFIMNNMFDESGFLLHSYQKDIKGNLDDYVFFINGLLELYEATFEIIYLKEAIGLTDKLHKHFWDKSSGGYFFTSDFADDLIVRKKEIYDGAIPSGNSVQLSNLIRISKLTGEVEYDEYIKKMIEEYSSQVINYPTAYTEFLTAFSVYIAPSIEIVLAGKSIEDLVPFLHLVNKYKKSNIFVTVKTEENVELLEQIAEFTKDMKMLDEKPTAYVCKNFACEQPVNDVELFEETLKQIRN